MKHAGATILGYLWPDHERSHPDGKDQSVDGRDGLYPPRSPYPHLSPHPRPSPHTLPAYPTQRQPPVRGYDPYYPTPPLGGRRVLGTLQPELYHQQMRDVSRN